MKLPFSFGSRLVFRLALPGSVLTLACWPAWSGHSELLAAWLSRLGWAAQVSGEVAFGVCVVFSGWLVTLLDSPIYMLLEGRRYWPIGIWQMFKRSEERRLEVLQRRAAQGGSDATEYHLRAAEFPLGPNGLPVAQYPTRLGNILTEHETYPDRKYGMDGVFFWHRIWLLLDKDTRVELDERQAALDGIVYSSAVLYFAAGLHLAVAIVDSCVSAEWARPSFMLPPMFWLAGYMLYRAALPGYVQYGEHFKAIFDHTYGKLDLEPQLSLIARESGERWVAHAPATQAPKIVWAYLRWHRFRPGYSASYKNFEDVRKEALKAVADGG